MQKERDTELKERDRKTGTETGKEENDAGSVLDLDQNTKMSNKWNVSYLNPKGGLTCPLQLEFTEDTVEGECREVSAR